jgi:hypothetical protein
MITKASIKAIKTAQRCVAMPDAEYRALLQREFNVASCKSLNQGEVGKALDLISAFRPARKAGWTWSQIERVRTYARWAGLDTSSMRVMIHQVSGYPHEESPALTEYHFDVAMALVEGKIAARVADGETTWPSHIQPRYWRTRNSVDGSWNSRQRHMIMEELWPKLQPYLPESERNFEYLAGIAAQACGYRIASIWGLKAWQAHLLTEALKDRLRYAIKKGA